MLDDKKGELNEIISYNGNDKDFYHHIEILNQPLNFPTIYSDSNPNNKKYTGEIINGKYNGRGILYDEKSGKIIYEGSFKEGRYDGFGKKYDHWFNLYYIGFFSNDEYNGKDTI